MPSKSHPHGLSGLKRPLPFNDDVESAKKPQKKIRSESEDDHISNKKKLKSKSSSVRSNVEEEGNERDEGKSFRPEKRKRKTTKFQIFLEVARLMTSLCHPYPPFLQIFQAGLERDGLMDEDLFLCEVSEDDYELKFLHKCYDFIKNRIGVSKFQHLILEILSEEKINQLVRDMNIQAGDAISQDTRALKDLILSYAEDTLDEELYPRIKPTAKKCDTRGYHHPQLARLLVPPGKLQVFLLDPNEFCAKYLENELEGGPIQGQSIRPDPGRHRRKMAFESLLYGWIILQTMVRLYLGDANAALFQEHYKDFRERGEAKRFKFKKVGPAWNHKITTVTMEMFAYTTFIVRHSLSSCDYRRIEEDNTIKSDAFDAVMALVEDPNLHDEPFINGLMDFYTYHIGWMLPQEKKQTKLRDAEDPECSLNQLAILKKKRDEARRAEALKANQASQLKRSDTSTSQRVSDAGMYGTDAESNVSATGYVDEDDDLVDDDPFPL